MTNKDLNQQNAGTLQNLDTENLPIGIMQHHLGAAFVTYIIDQLQHGTPADTSFADDAKMTYLALTDILKAKEQEDTKKLNPWKK